MSWRGLQVVVFGAGLLVGGRGCLPRPDHCWEPITLEQIPAGTCAISESWPDGSVGEIRVFDDRVELQLTDETLAEGAATYTRTGPVEQRY